ILLLDFFNTLGMPTSTTVSFVFELLGAAVAMALIKIAADNGQFAHLIDYINYQNAIEIVLGILASVVIAFTVGLLVQWIARAILSYDFEKRSKWKSAFFGGIALTSIIYFILIKGIGGTPYADRTFAIIEGMTIQGFLENRVLEVVLVNLVFWSLLAYALMAFAKVN